MTKAKNGQKRGYVNVILAIFDAWELFNRALPQKLESQKKASALEAERKKKLAPVQPEKDTLFSPAEIALIYELNLNPRKSYIELAKNLGVSRHTVKNRIEKMLSTEKIQFCLGINYQKLNFDILFMELIAINLVKLDEILLELENCPRVFLIIKDIPKNGLKLLLGVERTNFQPHQYLPIIERLQLDERIKECNIISLNPELFPQYLIFLDKNFPKSGKIAPCGENCKICENFLVNKCLGCPATEWYRGNVFKIED
ncbi:MAG: AsnC family transcriptional regulator [Candidatus Helarchaeota archaeon]